MIQQEIFDFHKTESLNWNDFIESEENRDALSALIQWQNWSNNGMVITGSSGVGKSHLAALWAQSANAVYVLKDSVNYDPRDLFENNCNFVLDEISQFLSYQDWLFHFYNIAREKKRFFLITDRLPRYLWNISLKDLQSRLMSLSAVEIKNPGDELLFKVCKKLARDFDIEVPDDVISYILQTTERNVSVISQILRTLDKLALQEKKNISLKFVQRYLKRK